MNFDYESLKQALGTLATMLGILKQARDLLPDGPKKLEINSAIENAEKQLKIAESQTAQGMGYELCKNHFPPEIMLSKDNKIWKCPTCGNEIDKTSKPPKYFVKGRR